jgi:hypothetical protein
LNKVIPSKADWTRNREHAELAEVVGSNLTTRSIFISLVNYGIKLSLFRFDKAIRLLEEIGVNVTHR